MRVVSGALQLRHRRGKHDGRSHANSPQHRVWTGGEGDERIHRVRESCSRVGPVQGPQRLTGFSIPRVAIAATLLQTAGATREGEIYVMERVPQHAGPETPLDMLNRTEGFFPFRPKGDANGVMLVAKARTVSLTVPRPVPEDQARLSAAKQARLEVTLADGTQLRGWAILELPQHHSRVLDYLNAAIEPFFAIATDDGVHLVNRTHVLYARPED